MKNLRRIGERTTVFDSHAPNDRGFVAGKGDVLLFSDLLALELLNADPEGWEEVDASQTHELDLPYLPPNEE